MQNGRGIVIFLFSHKSTNPPTKNIKGRKMKGKEQLQTILDKKIESLEGLCYTLDGATEWCEIFFKAGYCHENKDELFKTMMVFADTYQKFVETKQAIKVLKYVLDIPDETK